MKKILLTIASLLLAFSTFAQNAAQSEEKNTSKPYKNEISLTYGRFTTTQLNISFGMALKNAYTLPEGYKLDNLKSSGAFALDYMRYLNNGKLALGGIFGYEKLSATYTPTANGINKTENYNLFTVMPAAKFVWFNQKVVAVYSRLAGGIYWETSSSKTGFAFQIDLAGVEVGGEHVRGFFTLGFGQLGILKAGIRTSF